MTLTNFAKVVQKGRISGVDNYRNERVKPGTGNDHGNQDYQDKWPPY